MPNKSYKDMTPEEKLAAFDKLMAGREGRKGQGKARRTAIVALIKTHKAEYDKLFKAAGGVAKAA